METQETPVPLPSAPSIKIAEHLFLQPPLSRRGYGPGLVLVTSESAAISEASTSLDPPPIIKWAEEGYAVVQISLTGSGTMSNFENDLARSVQALVFLDACDKKDRFGAIVYSGSNPQVMRALDKCEEIKACIVYGLSLPLSNTPQLLHLASAKCEKETHISTTIHYYPDTKSSAFAIPGHEDYNVSAASICHTRSLKFLKKHLDGPFFDLEAIWDEHTEFEFINRSVAKTMGTMVAEPYVNHIPTMTGGIGRERLENFYRCHFIWNNPEDTRLELVSRTVGIDRIVDEFVFNFTHDKTIDWLLPGLPPTWKKVRIPFTSIVNIRGDRLSHEHIAWDQATVLRQLDLLPEYLPFPFPLEKGRKPAPGKRFEYRVPVAGVETAVKLVNENAVASNAMFEFGVREVENPSCHP